MKQSSHATHFWSKIKRHVNFWHQVRSVSIRYLHSSDFSVSYVDCYLQHFLIYSLRHIVGICVFWLFAVIYNKKSENSYSNYVVVTINLSKKLCILLKWIISLLLLIKSNNSIWNCCLSSFFVLKKCFFLSVKPIIFNIYSAF